MKKLIKNLMGIIIMLSMVISCIINIRIGKWINYIFTIWTIYSLFTFGDKYKESENILNIFNSFKIKNKFIEVIFIIIVLFFTGKCIINGIVYLQLRGSGYVPYIIYIFGSTINILSWKRFIKDGNEINLEIENVAK